jgi:cation:H+ antiporter
VSLLTSAVVFALSLGALLVASDRFTDATERISLSFGVSPFLVGATVVAGGTSLPELVSSVLAVVEGAPGIVLGTAVGSNVANIFLVLGIAAVTTRRIRIERELFRVDLPLLMASAVFLTVAVWDGTVTWVEGLLGVAGLAVYVHFTLSQPGRLDETVEELVEEHGEEVRRDHRHVEVQPSVGVRTYATIAASLVVVFVAADQLVGAILSIAAALDVGTDLVAISAVAIGTSLPEVAVSVTAVRRGSWELTVGNVLGSNVFNSFAVVGVPTFVATVPVPANVRTFAVPVMVLATVLYYFITQDREITRWEGLTLLLLYALFVATLVG